MHRDLRFLLGRATGLRLRPQQPRRCRYSTGPPARLPPPSPSSAVTAAPAPEQPREERRYSTALAKQLAEAMKATGPVPLATYMRHCLTGDLGGYYNTSDAERPDPFGRTGDFVTSPEISQLFGETLGIWFLTEWMSQGRQPVPAQLVELGPGRGTLMADVLRTLANFKDFFAHISAVYLVESSPALRDAQARLLCGDDAVPEDTPDGGLTALSRPEHGALPVSWYDSLQQLPAAATPCPYILAHEFFDALPIHAFEATPAGWRELLVSPSPSPPRSPKEPDFVLSRADTPTRHSLLLPELSPRYRALASTPGAVVEISPDALAVAEEIARRIGMPHAGAALVVDYGPPAAVPANSLRGIRAHCRVSPLVDAGAVDLSADVDFCALAERALAASPHVEVHGPVAQGPFLLTMGMRERLAQLTTTATTSAAVHAEIEAGSENHRLRRWLKSGFRRLADTEPGAMGAVYKVLAVVPERDGKKPVGFGGAVYG